jgi:hypothetical protein
LLGASAGVGAIIGRQSAPTSDAGPSFPGPVRGSVVLDDASQLSPTPVASHITIREDPHAAVERIRAALTAARSAGQPCIASTARHSMGGQSLARDGTVVTLDQQWLQADRARKAYRVAAGTRWSTVIASLRRACRSPEKGRRACVRLQFERHGILALDVRADARGGRTRRRRLGHTEHDPHDRRELHRRDGVQGRVRGNHRSRHRLAARQREDAAGQGRRADGDRLLGVPTRRHRASRRGGARDCRQPTTSCSR